jgi:hypothetical protein
MNITAIRLKIAELLVLENAQREITRWHIQKLKQLVRQRRELERLLNSYQN